MIHLNLTYAGSYCGLITEAETWSFFFSYSQFWSGKWKRTNDFGRKILAARRYSTLSLVVLSTISFRSTFGQSSASVFAEVTRH